MKSFGVSINVRKCKHSPQICYVTTSKQSNLLYLHEMIYKDATILMERKKNKFDMIIEMIKKAQLKRQKYV